MIAFSPSSAHLMTTFGAHRNWRLAIFMTSAISVIAALGFVSRRSVAARRSRSPGFSSIPRYFEPMLIEAASSNPERKDFCRVEKLISMPFHTFSKLDWSCFNAGKCFPPVQTRKCYSHNLVPVTRGVYQDFADIYGFSHELPFCIGLSSGFVFRKQPYDKNCCRQ